MNIANILIPIALLLNSIAIHKIWKRIDNMESWVKYLLRRDIEYCTYIKRKTRQTEREE